MNAKIMTVEKVSKSFSMSLAIGEWECNTVEMQTIEKFSLPSLREKQIFLLTKRRAGGGQRGRKKLNTRQNDKLTGISEYNIRIQSQWRQIFKIQ